MFQASELSRITFAALSFCLAHRTSRISRLDPHRKT
jgi:hypothetical protein